MKKWVVEIEIETRDDVTRENVEALARQIGDDAAMRASDELAGDSVVDLGDVRQVSGPEEGE